MLDVASNTVWVPAQHLIETPRAVDDVRELGGADM
jgi:hypothetical protein